MTAVLQDGLHAVRANGIDIHFEIRGQGPWVVLSHSLACDRSMWDEQMEALSARYRVLRYDTRGHGRSTATSAPYTLEVLAEDLAQLLGALGIERPHFVGLSMGGMIGQTLAVRAPGAFRTLTLCDTTSAYPASVAAVWDERIRTAREKGMPALVESTLSRWFTEEFRRARPDVVRRFASLISATPVEGYIGCSQALVKIDVTERLRTLAMPALAIVGERDPGTPVAMARTIAENLPGARLAVIPRAAHISNVEQPDAFNRLLLEFLDAHR
jgi:3-oxoadipate enol-lactonase